MTKSSESESNSEGPANASIKATGVGLIAARGGGCDVDRGVRDDERDVEGSSPVGAGETGPTALVGSTPPFPPDLTKMARFPTTYHDQSVSVGLMRRYSTVREMSQRRIVVAGVKGSDSTSAVRRMIPPTRMRMRRENAAAKMSAIRSASGSSVANALRMSGAANRMEKKSEMVTERADEAKPSMDRTDSDLKEDGVTSGSRAVVRSVMSAARIVVAMRPRMLKGSFSRTRNMPSRGWLSSTIARGGRKSQCSGSRRYLDLFRALNQAPPTSMMSNEPRTR